MKRMFLLNDINELKNMVLNSSYTNDCLKIFLENFKFESVYKTEDNTTVYYVGGENRIEIEFANFENPINRTCSVMYYENGNTEIIYF